MFLQVRKSLSFHFHMQELGVGWEVMSSDFILGGKVKQGHQLGRLAGVKVEKL